jgi:hypothetical protein
MFMSRHQNAGQNHNINIAKNLSKMWQSSNIWVRETNQNNMYEEKEIKFEEFSSESFSLWSPI